MRPAKFIAAASLILQSSLVHSEIYIDGSCDSTRTDIVKAVNLALEWAAKANNSLAANDKTAVDVANMLFNDVADASSRLKKVGEYGTIQEGDAPNTVKLGDLVIYCDTKKWDSPTSGGLLRYNKEAGFYEATSRLDDVVDPKTDTMAITCRTDPSVDTGEFFRADVVIIGTRYLSELAKGGHRLSKERIQLVKDGKRSQKILDNLRLKMLGACPVDLLMDNLAHTLLHEFTHGNFAGRSDDVDKPRCYGWKDGLRVKSSTNADSLATMGLVAWLIANQTVSVNKDGKLFDVA